MENKRIVKCKKCGKLFFYSIKKHLYCSEECKAEALCEREQRRKEREMEDDYSQPCWTCRKYIDGCSWSRDFKPVEGWEAEIVLREDECEADYGYRIYFCPEYERD